MNDYNDSFVNPNFHWFTGVIEDINDPLEMGRYKVRCFGYHSEIREQIQTDNLPWAHVMMPVTSASTSGIGHSATGLLAGSWVIGFFRDGSNAQDPVIMGSVPSMSETEPRPEIGFSDPTGTYPKKDTLNKPDTPRPARKDFNEDESYKRKKELQRQANDGACWTLNNLGKINPEYPTNHVYKSESGHVLEFDDTSGSERISLFHKAGSFYEITQDGDNHIVISGNNYEVVIKDKNVYVKGDLTMCVDGDVNTKVGGNYNLDVSGDYVANISGQHNITASQTNIFNDVYTDGLIEASVEVLAGTNQISLVKHTHTDTKGLGAGITTKPNP
tara:strand:- start:705 stop:1694 length:990 start_codon:yes stop_codon:yes gene_type:complete